MTEKEINFAHKGCRQNLGYVPTEEEGLAVYKEHPGLVKLYMNVMSSQFDNRNKNKELYSYDREPNGNEKVELGVGYSQTKKRS